MIPRRLQSSLAQRLDRSPAVVLIGPRQVGKTTLALRIADGWPSIYLDLELESDRAKLSDPELYLGAHADELVVLDEIQRVPELFPTLRALIDRGRRVGRRNALYLLLGSASLDLLRQTSETLAGRLSILELGPLDVTEVGPAARDALWLRGGFPEAFLAPTDADSFAWRRDFVRTYLERDVPQFGPRIPAETLRRFWTMLAHGQASLLNAAEIARSLAVDGKTVARYLDLLVDLLLVRRLPPWHGNVGKRLVRSPKVYVRDSGLVHALLGLPDLDALLGHPVAGASWEGFVVETVCNRLAEGGLAEPHFYRTAAGAEIDLVIRWFDGRIWAVEIKRSAAPRLGRGFHQACADLQPERRFVIHAGADTYPLDGETQAVPLAEFAALLPSPPFTGGPS